MVKEEDTVTFASCALVIRTSLQDFEGIKRDIQEKHPTATIVYQKTAPGHLWIQERKESIER